MKFEIYSIFLFLFLENELKKERKQKRIELCYQGENVDLSSLLTGENANYIDALYLQWQEDSSSVSEEWQALFQEWEVDEEKAKPVPIHRRSIFSGTTQSNPQEVAYRQARVAQLINAYRVRGHTEAQIDPLGRKVIEPHPELRLDYYGLTEDDLDKSVSGHGVFGVEEITTPREIIQRIRKAYCGGFGVEFMNINDPKKKKWLQKRIETLHDTPILSLEDQKYMLRNLSDAENFEQFLHRRYQYTKRFSLEGAETLVPLLAVILDGVEKGGAERVMIGMAHRGRLNVLANICNKPVQFILNEFDDEVSDSFDISGDVKYHLGYSNDYETSSGNTIRVTMAFNPSHLEAVNPVVLGRARARQDDISDDPKKKVVPLLIHGDAAVAGQGVVAEVLQMSGLDGYQTGGTIHVVTNNQIGFTTSPIDARSTPYCTDVARMLAVPIFHVNGEDVEAVAAVAKIAAEWRQTFHQDVFIDMYCFRKWGHNEGDEPSFTQPLLYQDIRKHPSTKEMYAKNIIARGALSREEVDEIVEDSALRLQNCLDNPLSFESYTTFGETEMKHRWEEYTQDNAMVEVDTSIDKEALCDVLLKLNQNPTEVSIHRKVQRVLRNRVAMIEGKNPVDWALAEQAAYATLVQDGFRIRISGQDVGRGTFSHRHAVLTDINNGKEYVPLAHLSSTKSDSSDIKAGPAARLAAAKANIELSSVEGTGRGGRILRSDVIRDAQNQAAPFEIYNSLLSEYAVLGFEHGYSLDCPEGLIIWEAQFGDFANGAQIMIDNFIMATEQKWNRYSGLVMLLPHGYAGQGPEHSSARLERFLQLCAEDNVTVANISTPANFFHLLRRQMLRKVRKPLVVMSPKSLLRHPKCISTLDELAGGQFQKIIPEKVDNASTVENIVFCSGKVYYDILAHREMVALFQNSTSEDDKGKVRSFCQKFGSLKLLERLEAGEKIDCSRTMVTRVEQLYPFPEEEIKKVLTQFNNPKIVWCQEEPRNMGAWPMVDEWLCEMLDGGYPHYIGRSRSASPATGSPKIHKVEQSAIIEAVFQL